MKSSPTSPTPGMDMIVLIQALPALTEMIATAQNNPIGAVLVIAVLLALRRAIKR